MDDFVPANGEADMALKKQQVAAANIISRYRLADFDLVFGISGQGDPKAATNGLDQTGAIKASRGDTTPQVRHAQETLCF